MKRNHYVEIAVILAGALVFSSCRKSLLNDCVQNNTTATVKVFATGLNNPRGLKFGPDGSLYVAEGGKGGTNSTKCVQVVPPVGPYKGSETGSGISKINMDGFRTVLTDALPSSINALGDVSGVGDIEFIGNNLYALLTGAVARMELLLCKTAC